MEKKISFRNSNKQKIIGIINEFDKNSKKIILVIHGYASHKNGRTNKWILQSLNKQKLNSLRIDLNGCKESQGKFENQTISNTIDDVVSAINFLKKKNYDEISLIGNSAGGMTAIGATIKTQIIKKLFLIAPATNYVTQRIRKYKKSGIKKWKEKGHIFYEKANGEKFKVNYSFFEDAHNHIMKNKSYLIKCPVLIVHGDKDDVVPFSDTYEFAQKIENKKIVIIKGASHNFLENNNYKKIQKLIINFFSQ